ncbi:hypothetical protein EJB05_55556 [Eragrostis curvula]|uniref:DUF1985 domain-containing protein n=1 Tax=Eragrostis curvula TaxID=38414 RepID=A0A5J9SJE1_9POAL|nr:hypothetical protein EJB05_55556 [Eragrostis curvula]
MTKRKFYKAAAVEEDVSDPSVEIVDDDDDDDDDDEDYASEGSESVSARNTFRDLRSKSATITDDAIFQVIKRVTCNTIRQFVCDEGISASRKRRRKGSVNMPTPKLGAPDGAGSSKTSTRFNVTYFADVIEDLDDHQKKVIGDYGFGFLLDFDRCFIPHPFARWIADHVRVKTSDIVVNNRSIPLSKESVHDVVGTPIGGKRIEKDSAGGKAAFLSLMNRSTLPKITEFGDKLKKKNLSDDEIVKSFLVVALANFLCPNSNTILCPDYLTPLIDIKTAKDWDWSDLVYVRIMKVLTKYQSLEKKAAPGSSVVLGGCMYYLCVVYLDYLDFAHRTLPPPTIPRIKVWKQDMIKVIIMGKGQ